MSRLVTLLVVVLLALLVSLLGIVWDDLVDASVIGFIEAFSDCFSRTEAFCGSKGVFRGLPLLVGGAGSVGSNGVDFLVGGAGSVVLIGRVGCSTRGVSCYFLYNIFSIYSYRDS